MSDEPTVWQVGQEMMRRGRGLTARVLGPGHRGAGQDVDEKRAIRDRERAIAEAVMAGQGKDKL